MRVIVLVKATADSEAGIEIRPLFEASDFAEAMIPGQVEEEERSWRTDRRMLTTALAPSTSMSAGR